MDQHEFCVSRPSAPGEHHAECHTVRPIEVDSSHFRMGFPPLCPLCPLCVSWWWWGPHVNLVI